jgi:plastocyanin
MLVLTAVVVLLPVRPAAAEELVVTITAEGVRPQVLVAQAGDTVRFVNEDRSFAYRAQSTGGPWRFDSGPTTLLTDDFAVPEPVTRPGTYAFRVAQDPPYRGTVLVGVPAPSAGAPSPGAPGPGAASPGPGVPPAATSAPTVPPPPVPQTPTPPAQPSVGPAAVPGSLPGEPSGRRLGLPTALAAVLVVGAGSLLLRLLLAEPVLSEGPATL